MSCIICTEALGANRESNVLATKCGHVFHFNCINTWLNNSDNCPSCRQKVESINTLIKLFFDDYNDDDDEVPVRVNVPQNTPQNDFAEIVESAINLTVSENKNMVLTNENLDLKAHIDLIQSDIEDCNRKYEETLDNLRIERKKTLELKKLVEELSLELETVNCVNEELHKLIPN